MDLCSPTIRGETVTLRIFLAKQEVLALHFLLLGRTRHQKIQVFQVHRLLDEVVSAFFHGGHGLFHRTVGGDEDDRNIGIGCLVSRSTSKPNIPAVLNR